MRRVFTSVKLQSADEHKLHELDSGGWTILRWETQRAQAKLSKPILHSAALFEHEKCIYLYRWRVYMRPGSIIKAFRFFFIQKHYPFNWPCSHSQVVFKPKWFLICKGIFFFYLNCFACFLYFTFSCDFNFFIYIFYFFVMTTKKLREQCIVKTKWNLKTRLWC